MGLLDLTALWLGKLLITVSRWLGRGGSTFPGRVVRRVRPGLLRLLSSRSRRGNVIITGTNGKTTTATMLAGVCRSAGYRPTHNRTGANLIFGITAAFVEETGWWGKTRWDLGLVEVDEATVPGAAAEVRPRVMVVTNFCRDQLDRYGELLHTVGLVRRGLEVMNGGWAVLNADDPLVAGLGHGSRVKTLYFGVDAAAPAARWHDDPGGDNPGAAVPADAKYCFRCGAPYIYQAVYYAHLGRYRCPQCGYGPPEPDVRLLDYLPLAEGGAEVMIGTPSGVIRTRLSVPGLYNAYNVLAAAAAAHVLEVDPGIIDQGIRSFGGSFGRMEAIPIGDRRVCLALVKNPVGCNEVIRTIIATPGNKGLVLAINDNFADGTDISWLWDVDFERLAECQERFGFLIATGVRAEDMALRLKYAGIDPSQVVLVPESGRALQEALQRAQPGETVYVLPTYTAMLELRSLLEKMGHVRRFWEN